MIEKPKPIQGTDEIRYQKIKPFTHIIITVLVIMDIVFQVTLRVNLIL